MVSGVYPAVPLDFNRGHLRSKSCWTTGRKPLTSGRDCWDRKPQLAAKNLKWSSSTLTRILLNYRGYGQSGHLLTIFLSPIGEFHKKTICHSASLQVHSQFTARSIIIFLSVYISYEKTQNVTSIELFLSYRIKAEHHRVLFLSQKFHPQFRNLKLSSPIEIGLNYRRKPTGHLSTKFPRTVGEFRRNHTWLSTSLQVHPQLIARSFVIIFAYISHTKRCKRQPRLNSWWATEKSGYHWAKFLTSKFHQQFTVRNL